MNSWGSSWLNIAGKAVLIKAVLNNLPIFRFAILLAPVGTIKKMDELIRGFFWRGGKHNDKKFSLISWDIVTKPYLEGGLNLKDLYAKNLAMGAKLAWKIIAPNPSWAQIALWKKYFRGPRLRCLDHPKDSTRSHLSILLSKIAPMINSCAHWVPGNGKKTQVWKDKIMNRPPLVDAGNFTALRNWMEAAHIHTLWDL